MTTSATSPSTTNDLGRLLDDLAWAIERDGIECHESAVSRAVTQLRATGTRGNLLDLVADRGEPAAARERAFGRIGRHSSGGTSRDRGLVAA